MSAVEITRVYTNVSVDTCYGTAEETLVRAGFEIWKTRPIGWLVIAYRQSTEGKISATMTVRPGTAAQLTLSLVGETLAEDCLRSIADEILDLFDDALGGET